MGPEEAELPDPQCSGLMLEDDEYILTMEVTYTGTYIQSVGFLTNLGNTKRWGAPGDKKKDWSFPYIY